MKSKKKKKKLFEFVNEFIIQQNRIQLSMSWYALLFPVKSMLQVTADHMDFLTFWEIID